MRRLLLTFTAFFVLTAPANAAWVWPVTGDVITPYRNGTDPYAAGQHRGIDIAAPVGTAVRAAAAGEVRFAGTAGTSGLTISIRTGDGYDTSYLHLSSLAVRAGAHVSAGERIGAVGTTGTRSATAPHLHFGVRDAGSRHAYHDPLAFLPPPAAPTRTPAPPAPAPAPAPEPTRPAPVPAPIPQRSPAPRGAPAPIPRRSPAPRGAPAPVPRHAPAPRGAPAPTPRRSPAPRGAPAPIPRRSPAQRGAPVLRRSPRPQPAPRGVPHGRPATGRVPDPSPSPGRAGTHSGTEPAPHESPLPAPPHRRAQSAASAAKRDAGPDIGWAVACAGLLLAAAILGLSGDGRRRTKRTRTKLAAGLRPLAGGR